jgi:uncharacterized membrane protein
MKWFIGIMSILCLISFIGICTVDKIMMKEDKDPVYHEKWERIRKRLSPKITFFENLIGWVFAILVIYFIYLG